MSMTIKIDNTTKVYTLIDLKEGDIFSFNDSLWGKSKVDLFLAVKDGYVDIGSNWTYYPYHTFEDCFDSSNFYGSEDDWEYFVNNLETYPITIYNSNLILKKRP